MKARDYLENIRHTDKKILSVKTELASIREQKDGLKSAEMSERVKSSVVYSDTLDSLIVREDKLVGEYQRILSDWWKCRSCILKISNQDRSDVLRYKYLLGYKYKSWDAISEKMHISRRNIFILHGKALEDFRKISGMV